VGWNLKPGGTRRRAMLLVGVAVGFLSQTPSFLPLLQAKPRTTKANSNCPTHPPNCLPSASSCKIPSFHDCNEQGFTSTSLSLSLSLSLSSKSRTTTTPSSAVLDCRGVTDIPRANPNRRSKLCSREGARAWVKNAQHCGGEKSGKEEEGTNAAKAVRNALHSHGPVASRCLQGKRLIGTRGLRTTALRQSVFFKNLPTVLLSTVS
jgi:hypothetical protein